MALPYRWTSSLFARSYHTNKFQNLVSCRMVLPCQQISKLCLWLHSLLSYSPDYIYFYRIVLPSQQISKLCIWLHGLALPTNFKTLSMITCSCPANKFKNFVSGYMLLPCQWISKPCLVLHSPALPTNLKTCPSVFCGPNDRPTNRQIPTISRETVELIQNWQRINDITGSRLLISMNDE